MFRLTVTAVSLSFALGCGSGSKPDAKGDPKTTDPKKQAQGLSTPGVPDGPEAVAQKSVADFFAALKAKTATPDQLTPEFKKVVAPPFGGEPIGFADAKAKDFLAKWATVTADPPKAEVAGDVAFAAGKPGPGGRVLMRLRKDADGWKVDWLSNGPATASVVKLDGGADTAGVQFTVAAFTDAVLAKRYTLVAGQMTAQGRESVAPAFSADKARGNVLDAGKDKAVVLAGPLHYMDYWTAGVQEGFWNFLALYSRGPGVVVVDIPRTEGVEGPFVARGVVPCTEIRFLRPRLVATEEKP